MGRTSRGSRGPHPPRSGRPLRWLIAAALVWASAGITLVGVPAGVTGAAAQTLTFAPTADTYVDSGSPTTNFGTSADLVVGGNSSNVGIG
ncbi:MAG TPA: hypothetical protein VFN57_13520, partial [Thermomicrobiaceae bacterium]|nr:hypothetical protein [Thermomicrobiaceae bacterium]